MDRNDQNVSSSLADICFPDTLHAIGKGAKLYGPTNTTVLEKIGYFCRIPVTVQYHP